MFNLKISIILFFKKIKLYINTFNVLKYLQQNLFKLFKFLIVSLSSSYLIILSTYNLALFTSLVNILYKYIFLLLFLYYIISIFIRLNKLLGFGKYNTMSSRFWKRSYVIFWCLEISLFLLFIFLLYIHHKENKYSLDLKKCFYNLDFILQYFFFNSLVLLLLIILNYYILYFKKYSNNKIINLLLMFISLVLLYVNYTEFLKFIYVVNYYSYLVKSNSFLDTNSLNLYSYSFLDFNVKIRNLINYNALLIILKFWHVVFIYIYFSFFLNNFINTNTISYNLASSNLQNFIFLYFFNYVCYILLLKDIFLFFFKFYYSWFFFYFNIFNVNFLLNDIFLFLFFFLFG